MFDSLSRVLDVFADKAGCWRWLSDHKVGAIVAPCAVSLVTALIWDKARFARNRLDRRDAELAQLLGDKMRVKSRLLVSRTLDNYPVVQDSLETLENDYEKAKRDIYERYEKLGPMNLDTFRGIMNFFFPPFAKKVDKK